MDDKTPTLDLSETISINIATLEFLYPGSSKPTGWKLELCGPAHPKSIAVSNEIARERIEKEKAIEFAQVNVRKWKPEEETPEERARKNVARLVKRINGWSPDPVFKFYSPDPIPFSEEKAVDLFLKPEMGAFLSQLADYFMSEKAFTQGSATN